MRLLAALYIFMATMAPSPAWASVWIGGEAAQMQRPPSTSMHTPVIMLASSQHR